MKSQIEQKEQRTKLLVINSCFFYWKEQIMNNHHKIISLHVVSLPKLWEIFSKKKTFSQQFRWVFRLYLTIFMGTSRHWTLK